MKLVEIYRSKKKEGMYLYIEKGTTLDSLPEALMTQFGTAEFSMVIKLTAERKLAQVSAEKVLQSLQDHGYYLQLPPAPESYMQQIPNSKMY
ncbi:YcgL domain-containing protein [Teredinibacter sp. KSP-S5-2]|uniref:YcgL domain-containing protein n=1 Tax=Teredinibacter sp. KSP-S5-2 TaxID=3034506 RepID=UPI002934FC8B|nr:YcgL domain-containing protein [Teredinibacter sp. KSP-S5-2]WNO11667.1 YcgL domain-containing protein [Teredinibacter sp. KSP-S5-2]